MGGQAATPGASPLESPLSCPPEAPASVWNSEIWSNAATMAKRKRAPSPERRAREKAAPAAPTSVATRIGIAAMSFALFSTALVVDTGADSAFDAPKRLFCLVLTAVAAAALALGRPRWLLSKDSPLLA